MKTDQLPKEQARVMAEILNSMGIDPRSIATFIRENLPTSTPLTKEKLDVLMFWRLVDQTGNRYADLTYPGENINPKLN